MRDWRHRIAAFGKSAVFLSMYITRHTDTALSVSPASLLPSIRPRFAWSPKLHRAYRATPPPPRQLSRPAPPLLEHVVSWCCPVLCPPRRPAPARRRRRCCCCGARCCFLSSALRRSFWTGLWNHPRPRCCARPCATSTTFRYGSVGLPPPPFGPAHVGS